MPYLGDPRENAICLSAHTIWEADNRVEERWQWGAQVIDLCDMSPEEYMKPSTVICSGCEGGGGDESGDTGSSETKVVFYFASTSNMDDITLDAFEEVEAETNTDTYFEYILGDPTEEDYNDDTMTNEELAEKYSNAFYLLVPNEFLNKMSVTENEISDVTNEFEVVDKTLKDGYTLLVS